MLKKTKLQPDLIITDYNLPIKNGIEITMEIKTFNFKTKILFVSANKQIKDLALAAGADGFVEKPFDFEKLIEKINNILKRAI